MLSMMGADPRESRISALSHCCRSAHAAGAGRAGGGAGANLGPEVLLRLPGELQPSVAKPENKYSQLLFAERHPGDGNPIGHFAVPRLAARRRADATTALESPTLKAIETGFLICMHRGKGPMRVPCSHGKIDKPRSQRKHEDSAQ
jgi:hypothetical protein